MGDSAGPGSALAANEAMSSLQIAVKSETPPPTDSAAFMAPVKPASWRLPPEIIYEIIALTRDWELATALRVPHRLPISPVWERDATVLDKALLDGRLAVVQGTLNRGYTAFTTWGARCIVRFGYVNVLDLLHRTLADELHDLCHEVLPNVASAWGRVNVLRWAVDSGFGLAGATEVAMDDASRHGHVDVLEFWRTSNQHLRYSEHALASATFNRQITVLDWWRDSGLPLKVGKVLDFASMSNCTDMLQWWFRSGLQDRHPQQWYSRVALYDASLRGRIPILEWWARSGLRLEYGPDVLVGATKHGRANSLEWWRASNRSITYTCLDIEEAIEDCIGDQAAVKAFWTQHGLFEQSVQDWMKSREFCRESGDVSRKRQV